MPRSSNSSRSGPKRSTRPWAASDRTSWPPTSTLREAVRRLRAPERRDLSISAALLDQRALAGIGNIWRNETLFAERVDPLARVADLDDDTLRRLVDDGPAPADGECRDRPGARRPDARLPAHGTAVSAVRDGDPVGTSSAARTRGRRTGARRVRLAVMTAIADDGCTRSLPCRDLDDAIGCLRRRSASSARSRRSRPNPHAVVAPRRPPGPPRPGSTASIRRQGRMPASSSSCRDPDALVHARSQPELRAAYWPTAGRPGSRGWCGRASDRGPCAST